MWRNRAAALPINAEALRINLRNIQNLAPDRRPPLEQYLDFLERLRNDPARGAHHQTRRSRTWPRFTGYGLKPQESPAGGTASSTDRQGTKRRDKGLASKPGAEQVGANEAGDADRRGERQPRQTLQRERLHQVQQLQIELAPARHHLRQWHPHHLLRPQPYHDIRNPVGQSPDCSGTHT